jgi:glycosyltransferase involved in cell wall biosynthesis
MKNQDLALGSSGVSEPFTASVLSSTEAERQPFVSVIVPCLNEEKHIARCLDAILANDYPKDRMEILVVDGMSEDRTPEIVKGYAGRYPFIRLINNPEKHIPIALNLGIRNAHGETVIKMDAHSTYKRDHISLCVRYQNQYGAENVGGVCNMVPGSDTAVAQAIVLGLNHRFGSGNAQVKVGVNKPTWSDTAAFGCFRKELFARIGLFDERLLTSSDLDMNMRIRAGGGRILLVPEIVIDYSADSSLRKFWKHNFADGVWTTYVLRFGSKAWSWRHWVPLAFILSLLGSLIASIFYAGFYWLTLSIAGVYMTVNFSVSMQIALRKQNPKFLFLLPLVFATRHVAHGLGALFGLVLCVMPGEYWKGRRGLRA